nr:hypothetical protein [Acinetobacter baumannii]
MIGYSEHSSTADLVPNGYITAAIPVTGEGPVAIHAEAVDALEVTLMLQMQT